MLRSNDSWDPVVIDFGLAVFCDEEEEYIHYRCGTPGYIAPEILNMKGKHKVDVSCDIFSAGSMLHVMLANSYLFTGKTTN